MSDVLYLISRSSVQTKRMGPYTLFCLSTRKELLSEGIDVHEIYVTVFEPIYEYSYEYYIFTKQAVRFGMDLKYLTCFNDVMDDGFHLLSAGVLWSSGYQ
jgi:hypothetical protein